MLQDIEQGYMKGDGIVRNEERVLKGKMREEGKACSELRWRLGMATPSEKLALDAI
jgi:hypothetical protein